MQLSPTLVCLSLVVYISFSLASDENGQCVGKDVKEYGGITEQQK